MQIIFQAAFSGEDVVAYDINDDILAKLPASWEQLKPSYLHDVKDATPEKLAAAVAPPRGLGPRRRREGCSCRPRRSIRCPCIRLAVLCAGPRPAHPRLADRMVASGAVHAAASWSVLCRADRRLRTRSRLMWFTCPPPRVALHMVPPRACA